MALSRQVIISDGTTKQYPITFADGYLSRDEVKVYEEFDDGTPNSDIPFIFINDNLIELSRVPISGNKIVIERDVEADARKVNFIPQYIKSSDLNTMYKHLLYLIQSVLDGRFEEGIIKDLDMGFNRIYNIGAPKQDNDAVRLIDVKNYTDLAQSLNQQNAAHAAAAKVSETNAKASETAAKASQNAAAASAQSAANTVNGFDAHAADKQQDFDDNYTSKLNTFNSNATSKTNAFNSNAISKTNDFNTNATNKTTVFNNNASSKTTDFNDNATAKTTAFNDNYTDKKALIDAQVAIAESSATNANNYKDKAKEWAISQNLVDDEDYSSKHWAGKSKYWAEQAQSVTQVTDASETAKGIARIATDAEVGTGTDDSTIVTPKKLKAKYASLAEAQTITGLKNFTQPLMVSKNGTVLDIRNTSYPTQNVLPEADAYSSIMFNSMDGNYFTLIDTQMGADGASYARFIHKNPFKNKSSKIGSNVYSDGNSEIKLSADAVTLEASKVTVPTVATNVKDKQAVNAAWVNNWMVAQNPIGVTIATGNATSFTDVSLKTKDSSLDAVNNKTLIKTYYHDIVLDKNGKFIGYSQIVQNGTTGKSKHGICARATKEDGTNVTATISVDVGKDGEIITYAPTPSENSNDTNIANTGWVKVFRYSINAISATSGSINLGVTCVYKMTVTDTTTFVLPTTPVADKHNQIKLMLKVTGTPTINWGTTNFFNKQTPDITEGYYDVYFDYDPNLAAWVCGVMAKGAEDNA